MEYCMGMGNALKLKRKEFDDADDEVFADFCLSSPANKIRRLDADLPPIIEQDAAGIPLKHEQPMPDGGISNEVVKQVNPLDIEELPFIPENDEKAIVLFKPMNKSLLYSPNNFSIDPNLILSFKNRALSHTYNNSARPSEEGEADGDGENVELNGCKAIIPWVPSQPLHQRSILASQTEVPGTMESDDMGAAMMDAAMMDIEDAGDPNVGHLEVNDCIRQSTISEVQQHQWQLQQQHCMIPQPPLNTTTPLVWYR